MHLRHLGQPGGRSKADGHWSWISKHRSELEIHSWRSLAQSDGHLDRALRGTSVQKPIRRVARCPLSGWGFFFSLKNNENFQFPVQHVKNLKVITPILPKRKKSEQTENQ